MNKVFENKGVGFVILEGFGWNKKWKQIHCFHMTVAIAF